jgi:hypothetical protein
MEKGGLNWKKKKIIHYLSNFLPHIYFSFFFIILWFFVFCIIFQQSSFYKKKIVQFRLKNIYMQIFFISKEGKNWIRTLERVWSLLCCQKSLATQMARESITKKMLCWQNKRTSKRRGKRSMEYIVSR